MTSPPPEPDRRATVLVVDDTPSNLALIAALLKGTCRVKIAKDGASALRIAAGEEAPDLILLDVSMPEMDGYEVCRRLKAAPRTRDIPVVFLTGKGNRDDAAHGLALGAAAFLEKPPNPVQLIASVLTHLQRSGPAA